MALKDRFDLEKLFQNGMKPTEKDFKALIESTLNKREDKFMGVWKQGQSYRSGDVVVYNQALWQVPWVTHKEEGGENKEKEICSQKPPGVADANEWISLIVPVADNDWVVDEENKYMYAKIYQCVGIGKEVFTEAPEAKLEIVEEGKARYLIFPKPANMPVLSLFQHGDDENGDQRYFLTGLNHNQVGFNTDAEMGYVFRRGPVCEEGEEANLQTMEGDVLMTIRSGGASSRVAQVGISTLQPVAMLDITDEKKGRFLFSPEDKDDPVFSVINLGPEEGEEKNYLSLGVGPEKSVFISDAEKGFVFRHGNDYQEYCAQVRIDQGEGLMIIQKDEKGRPRIGIGTEEPEALIDATDNDKAIYQIDPEHKNDRVINIVDITNQDSPEYMAFGVGQKKEEAERPALKAKKVSESLKKAILLTNASKGFSFNQGKPYKDFHENSGLNQGKANVVIREDGKVGIGTENPEVRLEVTDQNDDNSGRFLFNLGDLKTNPALAIVNARPADNNYLTLGANNDTSIFITNSPYGFSFRLGESGQSTGIKVDVDQKSETLFSIQPENADSDNIFPKEIRIFPEERGKKRGIVNIKGKVGIYRLPKNYELDMNGTIRTLSMYQVADNQKMTDVVDIPDVLENLKKLIPIKFKWDKSAKFNDDAAHYGLNLQQVEEFFEYAVKTTSRDPQEDQSRAIAYQELVPVLVKAIKEQQSMIDDLNHKYVDVVKRLKKLEKGGQHPSVEV